MRRRSIALSLAVIASSILAGVTAKADQRAVVELFTSQGCSSCPAADKLAGELARLEHRGAVGDLDFLSVDGDFGHGRPVAVRLRRESAEPGRRAPPLSETAREGNPFRGRA